MNEPRIRPTHLLAVATAFVLGLILGFAAHGPTGLRATDCAAPVLITHRAATVHERADLTIIEPFRVVVDGRTIDLAEEPADPRRIWDRQPGQWPGPGLRRQSGVTGLSDSWSDDVVYRDAPPEQIGRIRTIRQIVLASRLRPAYISLLDNRVGLSKDVERVRDSLSDLSWCRCPGCLPGPPPPDRSIGVAVSHPRPTARRRSHVYPTGPRRGGVGSLMRPGHGRGKVFAVSKKLYVGNLAFGTTSADLEQLFGQFGTVTSASVVTDRETGQSRGFAFVEMADGADEAIKGTNLKDFQGRALTVNEAKPREDRPRSGGGGGRGGYGGGGGGGGGGRRY